MEQGGAMNAAKWYERPVSVTLSHGQWVTIMLGLWESADRVERDGRYNEKVAAMVRDEIVGLRDIIHAALPPVP